MIVEQGVKLDFKDVLIRPKRSKAASRAKVDLVRSYTTLNSKQTIKGIPIVASNMDTIGTLEMAEALARFEIYTCLHKHFDLETLIQSVEKYSNILPYMFYTMGVTDRDFERMLNFKGKKINICVDVANGYSEFFLDKVKKIRELFPDSILMVGNVVTPEMVHELLIVGGADIVKVGIGGGSACTTRIKTGVGYPQLSAIIECSDVAHGLGGLICSDGGCTCPGDVAKAFGGGSDFVMLGGMFAGHDECGGDQELVYDEKTGTSVKYVKFYGMSSKEAMDKYHGGVADYRTAEGKCVKLKYKGKVSNTVQDILGGLRSACAYVGAMRLKDLSKCTTFVRVNQQYNTVFN